jgi:hypothetical protein
MKVCLVAGVDNSCLLATTVRYAARVKVLITLPAGTSKMAATEILRV